jgi:hypothetical protein
MADLSDLLRGGAPVGLPQEEIAPAGAGLPGGMGAFLRSAPSADAIALEPPPMPPQAMPLGDVDADAPPKLSTALKGMEAPPPPKPVKGGSRASHDWNGKAGRWQAPDGKFLSGPPPKGAKGKP